MTLNVHIAAITSAGGSTSYYELPADAKELNDLIEHKRMSFALGNIFKACYRFGEKDAASRMYDLNKIIFFAERLKGVGGRPLARRGMEFHGVRDCSCARERHLLAMCLRKTKLGNTVVVGNGKLCEDVSASKNSLS